MMNNFSDVLIFFPVLLQQKLSSLSDEIKENTFEIRLRINKPVVLFGKYGTIFIKINQTYSSINAEGAYCITEKEFNETVSSICKYSVYSHQEDIKNGFVTFGNGNRAGFAGKAVVENGNVIMLSQITSINIRIASENFNLSDKLKYLIMDFTGILIAGPPCSGKTTILKSVAETLSSDYSYGFQKTTVIDQRYEMQNLKGLNCDILSGYPKADAIEHAVRTLSPQIIVCDEITSSDEIEKMAEGMYCGVKFIASIHLSTIKDIKYSPLFRKILNLGIFNYIVLLKNGTETGKIDRIIRTEELENDIFSDSNRVDCIGYNSIFYNHK